MTRPKPTIPDLMRDDLPKLSHLKIAIILWGDLLVLGAVVIILAIRYG